MDLDCAKLRKVLSKITSDPDKLEALCSFYNPTAVIEAKFDLAVSFPEIYQQIMKIIDLIRDPDSYSQRLNGLPMSQEDKIKVFRLFFCQLLMNFSDVFSDEPNGQTEPDSRSASAPGRI